MVAAKAGETTLGTTLAAAKTAVPETKVRLFKSTSMGSGPRYFEGVVRGNRTPLKYGNCGDFASAPAPHQGRVRTHLRFRLEGAAGRRPESRRTAYWYRGSSGRRMRQTLSVVVYSL